jgi:hypothetical protein
VLFVDRDAVLPDVTAPAVPYDVHRNRDVTREGEAEGGRAT